MNRRGWLVVASLGGVTAGLGAQVPAIERYTFTITLPDAGKRIAGEAMVEFRGAAASDVVDFDLSPAMRVTQVSSGCRADAPAAWRFERHGASLRIALPGQDGPAATRCLRIAYVGEPTDGLIIGTDSAGRWTAFGDNFPNRARYWLPTIDRPSAKAKVTWVVRAPIGREIVANGVRVSREATGGQWVTTWREDRAIPTYDMVIAAAPLAMHDLGQTACGWAEDGGCVPQMVYTAPEQARYMPGHFARAGDIVAFFSRTVGAFPYEKLAHLQTSTRYGGMENASQIYYADRLFRQPDGLGEGLIAHETAHQWFGNSATEREWAHAWLSEGFATFFAALWTQQARGDSAYRAEMAEARRTVLAAPEAVARAVIDSIETDPNRLLNRNTYQKGGLVLHMLRGLLGDSAFFRGTRAYYAAHRHANALTQDLQAAMEREAGEPLGWFFDQWLRKPGWAELTTSWQWAAGSGQVALTVEQGARFGAYRLPLAIDVEDASGAHHRVTVPIAAVARQTVVLPGTFSAAPVRLTFDPDTALLATFTTR